MTFIRHSLIGVFLLSLTIAGLALAVNLVAQALQVAMSDDAPPPPAQEQVFAVRAVPLDPGRVVPLLETFGTIQSRRTLEVRASAEGRVIWLSDAFVEGGEVAEGDVLARIDPSAAQADLDLSRADLAEAEADLDDAIRAVGLAEDDLEVGREQAALRSQALTRQRDLAARGVGSASAVETAALAAAAARQGVVSRRQALAAAEARVAQAETRRDRAEIAVTEAARALSETELRVGFSGRLANVTVVEGGLVSRNERLADLIDATALEAAARLSTAHYTRLLDAGGRLRRARAEVVIETSGLDLRSPGTILRESAVVGDGQTGREVFVGLDAPNGFRPGDIVTLRIEEPALDGVVDLPALAVGPEGEVLVIGADGRLSAGHVTRLRTVGDRVIAAAPGLELARIVAERTPLLGPGLKVRVLDTGAGSDDIARPVAGSPVGGMIALTPARRSALIDHVSADAALDANARARLLALLNRDSVPAEIVTRLEREMGI